MKKKNKITALVKELIAVPSVKENPDQLEKVLLIAQKELQGIHFEEFISNDNHSLLYYNTREKPEKFKIILNAHLDVVPGNEAQYQAVEKDGRLYGRGAYDMKAAAAAMILAFKDVADQVSYPLALQLVTDEEVGGRNGTAYQIEQGIRGEFVIGGEPSNLRLSYKSKGMLYTHVSFTGKTAHAAYPWDGENAIWKMKHFLDELEKAFPIPEKVTWKTTVNVAKIHTSNNTHNKVPADCTVTLDIRYIPEDKDSIVQKLEALIPADARLETLWNDPSHFTDKENPFVLELKNAIEAVTGVIPDFIEKHGASDLRHYDKVQCPAVLFGPVGEGLHSDQEWVDTNSLETYYQILKNFLLKVK